MRKFILFLSLFLSLLILVSPVFGQGSDLRVRNLYVYRGIDGRGGVPLWWDGFIYGQYAGTARDCVFYNYTGSGQYLMRLQGDGSNVFTIDKSGNVVVDGNLTVNGILATPYQQTITVAKSGGDYTTIQAAIDSIVDATSSKQYVILVYPGEYNETLIMKDYVHLDGQGATPREVMIYSNTGTVITWNTSGISHIHNITISSTPAVSTAKLVNSSAGTHAFERCLFLMSPSSTYVTGITVSGGTFYLDKGGYYYTATGITSGANDHILIQTSGSGIVQISYNLIQATVPDANDNIKIIDEATTITGETRIYNNIVYSNATSGSYSGNSYFYYSYGTGLEKFIEGNHIDLDSSGNGTGWAYWIDTTTNDGQMTSVANVLKVTNFTTNYWGEAATGDVLNVSFDHIEATNGFAGAGGINLVGSTAEGLLNVETSTTTDPTLSFKTTNTAHEITIYLDENAVNDDLSIVGQTAAVNTLLSVQAQDGEQAQLRLYSGATNHGRVTYDENDVLSLENRKQDADIKFRIDDGGVEKTIIWDADVDKLIHSNGTFDFDDDNLLTIGNGGFGTIGPDRKLDVLDATAPQIRATYADGTVYNDITTTSTGDLEITSNLGLLFKTVGAEFNTFVGEHSGEDLQATGTYNTCFGYESGKDITTSDYNTFIGAYSGTSITDTGGFNTFIGVYSGRDPTNSSYANSGMGYATLENLTTGDFNTGVGFQAMRGAVAGITGGHNSGWGAAALASISSGTYNMGIGRESLSLCTSGHRNTGVGAWALKELTDAEDNTAVGYGSNNFNQTGDDNTCVGAYAGYGVTGNSHEHNIFIGFQAGNSVTTGSDNIVIGYDQDLPAATTNNHLNIGGLIYGTIGSAIVGINTTGPDATLDVLNASGAQIRATHTDGTFYNDITTTGTGDFQITSNLGSLFKTNTTDYNVFAGEDSGEDIAAGGVANACFGYYAGRNITTGDYNVCVGWYAGDSITTSVENVFIGGVAGRDFTDDSGKSNVAIGYYALENGSTANYNVAIGTQAMQGPAGGVTGDSNVAIGALTLDALTSGIYNMGVGREALTDLTEGLYNSAIGALSSYDLTTARNNTTIGYLAGAYNETGWSNVCIGANAGMGVVGSSNQYNIFIGFQAGDSVTTGDDNIVIGYDQDLPAATTDNHLNIGGLVFGDLSSDLIGINTVTPDTIFEVADESADTVVTVSTYHDTEATTPTITMRKADNTEASPAAVDQNAILGTINFNGYDDDGWDNGARVYAQADANWGAAERGTELYFQTRDGNGALANQLKIMADGHIRAGSSEWYKVEHLSAIDLSPGGSGATQVVPTSDTLGGYNLDADGEYLYFTTHVHGDWDGASDILVDIHFECDVDNSGGNVGDDAEFDLLCYYKEAGETANKTQTPTIATVVGQSARYKLFEATVTIDYDLGGNVVDAGDIIAMRLNFDATNSDITDVVVTHLTFKYQTAFVNEEI